MNTKRSFLDNLNTGRQRRSGNSLEEINRTLDQLESRLGRALEPHESRSEEDNDIARRMERLSQRVAGRIEQVEPKPAARADLERIAHAIEDTRQQENHFASIGGIASELKTLRDDMRATMSSGIRDEFHALREELTRIMEALPKSRVNAELTAEFERLSNAIAMLAERSDDKSMKMLRLELEQVKSSLADLAREETVLSLDRRWDEVAGFDPAIQRLGERLEDINAAVNNLPETLSLRTLEERLRILAASLDQFAGQHDANRPDLYAMIEERLDEISRAVTASAALAHSPTYNTALLERIEARISSLSSQIDELVRDRPDGMIVERLTALSERVDEIAQRMDAPEEAMERMTGLIAQISEKLDAAPHQRQADQLFRGMEDRFVHLSDLIERRQEDVIQQGRSFFQDVERRLAEVAERFDRPGSDHDETGLMAAIDERFAALTARLDNTADAAAGSDTLRALEARLEDISGRLQNAASASAGIGPGVVRELETQVASLAAHLAQPGREFPDLEDLTPRLENIERSINENREAVLDIARSAAEQAVERMAGKPVDDRLKTELKNLQTLTKKSDERNTKTFEAIHDTLLKIVDRLGLLEGPAHGDDPDWAEFTDDKEGAGHEASLDTAAYRFDDGDYLQRRSAAEAAAAAADAALRGEIDADETGESRSMPRGLSHAFSPHRTEELREPKDDTIEVDADRLNEPLAPGSGAPDLNAIMRRVREESETRGEAAGETAKSDFIAAARRAAQAAAAEAESLKESRAKTADTGGRSTFGKFLRRRKLLLSLGAAVIIAASGTYLAGNLLRDGGGLAGLMQAESSDENSDVLDNDSPAASLAANDGANPEETVESIVTESIAEAPGFAEGEMQPADSLQAPYYSDADPGARTMDNQIRSQTMPAELQQAALRADELTQNIMDLPEIPADAGPIALREAAASGNAAALFEIANRYAEGRRVPADMAMAAEWYTRAAERGLAPAQYRIGNLHEKGLGVERDLSRAKVWYQLAAEQGNPSAMHNLGVLLAMGADGMADNESAAHWFIEAAELGVADSQFNLGILSVKGVGMPQDLTEAYKWFDIVARSGDADAAKKREDIAKTMAPSELAKAEAKAKLWTPREPRHEAIVVDIPAQWTEGGPATASVDMKRAVSNIQLILNKIGFDAGPADGVMGERTRAAIRGFQGQNGMAETGEIDDMLVRALLDVNDDGNVPM